MELILDKCVADAIRKFQGKVNKRDEALCIKKALSKKRLEHSAEQIAEKVDRERNVTPTVLRGVIRAEVNKITAAHTREVESLKAQLKNMKGKKEGKKEGDFCKTSKAAGRGSTNNKSCGGTLGQGCAVSTANKKAKPLAKAASQVGRRMPPKPGSAVR